MDDTGQVDQHATAAHQARHPVGHRSARQRRCRPSAPRAWRVSTRQVNYRADAPTTATSNLPGKRNLPAHSLSLRRAYHSLGRLDGPLGRRFDGGWPLHMRVLFRWFACHVRILSPTCQRRVSPRPWDSGHTARESGPPTPTGDPAPHRAPASPAPPGGRLPS
jgi:hypothetical protein